MRFDADQHLTSMDPTGMDPTGMDPTGTWEPVTGAGSESASVAGPVHEGGREVASTMFNWP